MTRRLDVVDFEPAHLAQLNLRPEQADDAALIGAGAMDAVARGPAYTVRAGDRIICCAGLAEVEAGHASAWALFADGLCLGDWSRLTRILRAVLDTAAYRRIDMLVRCDFPAAQRFARHLGFAPAMVLFVRAPRETFLVKHEVEAE